MDAIMQKEMQLLIGYADLGWKILPVYGMKAPGVCQCYKGSDCPSAGKHPVHKKDWASKASSDAEVIAAWCDEFPGCNWGLKLGPDSGVVDVEYDTPEGEATANEIFGECYTPTGKSKRSKHRFFKWSGEFPDKQKLEIRGLEIRIGGGGKSTQSVIPPSKHHSGAIYHWLPGLSPDDVDVAEAPDALLALIYNQGVEADQQVKEQFPPSKARKIHDVVKVAEGARNADLYEWACREAARCPRIDDPQEEADLLDKVLAMNAYKMAPPLDRAEVDSLFRSAVAFVKRKKHARENDTAQKYTIHGLTYEDGNWGPGDWQLTIVKSDPIMYRLHVPAWKDATPDGSGNVLMTVEDYRDAGKVAARVQSTTQSIILDDRPKQWPAIWNGQIRRGEMPTRGIKSLLMDAHKKENPPPTTKRYVIVAEYLLDKLASAKVADDPDLKVPATKRPDGSIWFRWKYVWQDGLMTQQITKGEPENLQARLGLTPGDFRYWPPRDTGGGRIRFCVLSPKHVAALDKLTDGEHEEAKNEA